MDIHVGWHNIEIFGMTYDDRNVWYPLVVNNWNQRLHVSRYLCAPTSYLLHYLGGRFYTALEDELNRLNYGDDANACQLNNLKFWAFSNYVYCWLFFTSWFHLVFHGVAFRGFESPGLRANHVLFRGVLSPLPPEIFTWIDEWGIRNLLRGSTIPPHLVDAALRVMRLIDWTVIPSASNLLGPYYRYSTLTFTGEVDGVPRRQVDLSGGAITVQVVVS